MTVLELMRDVLDDVPGGEVRGFLRMVKEEADRIWRKRAWGWSWKVTTLGPVWSGSGSLATGLDKVTVTEEDSFTDVYVGATIKLVDALSAEHETTISSVTAITGGVEFGLTANASALASGTVTVTVNAGVWYAPTDLRRVWRIGVASTAGYYEEHPGMSQELRDPRDYVLSVRDATDRHQFEFVGDPGVNEVYRLEYWRKRTAETAMSDTIDCPPEAQDALRFGVIGRVLHRLSVVGGNEQWLPRLIENQRLYADAIRSAAVEDGRRRRVQVRNARRMFELSDFWG